MTLIPDPKVSYAVQSQFQIGGRPAPDAGSNAAHCSGDRNGFREFTTVDTSLGSHLRRSFHRLLYSLLQDLLPGILKIPVRLLSRSSVDVTRNAQLIVREGIAVKKLLLVPLFLLLISTSVSAEGDKVRGENGQGDVNQVQVQDPPPFQESEALSWFYWLLGLDGLRIPSSSIRDLKDRNFIRVLIFLAFNTVEERHSLSLLPPFPWRLGEVVLNFSRSLRLSQFLIEEINRSSPRQFRSRTVIPGSGVVVKTVIYSRVHVGGVFLTGLL